MRGKKNTAAPDRAVAALAGRQHGIVSVAQLHRIGMTDREIEVRVEGGRLHRVQRGVVAVGHEGIGRRGKMLAAVLACGERAVLSHLSAAELHGIRDRVPVLIDVIAPGQRGRKLTGVRRHRVSEPVGDEQTVQDGIPCTTPARTLVDLAGMIGAQSLRAAIEESAVLGLLDPPAVDRILLRGPRRGAPLLRDLLRPWRKAQASPRLRSRLEAWLWSEISRVGLPLPECNVPLRLGGEAMEVDFLWEERRVVVETDGRRAHGTDPAFDRDRRRDQILVAAGYRAMRITWRHMELEPEATLNRLRTSLGAFRG